MVGHPQAPMDITVEGIEPAMATHRDPQPPMGGTHSNPRPPTGPNGHEGRHPQRPTGMGPMGIGPTVTHKHPQ